MYEIIYTCNGREERFYTGIKNLTKLEEEIKNLGKACEEMMETERREIERDKEIRERRCVERTS